MFLHREFVPGLAIASYMVGDEKTRQCAVIDPTRDVDEYVDIARRRGPAHHAHPRDARARRFRQRLGGAEGAARRRAADLVLGHGRHGVDAAVRRPSSATATRSSLGPRPAEGDPHPRPHARARHAGRCSTTTRSKERRGCCSPATSCSSATSAGPTCSARRRRRSSPTSSTESVFGTLAAAGLRRDLPRPRRRLALRQGDRLAPLLHARLRAAVQRGARAAAGGRVDGDAAQAACRSRRRTSGG